MSMDQIYSPDAFEYQGAHYERDPSTDRFYRHSRRRGDCRKIRISRAEYGAAYKNCLSETYDYAEEDPELAACLIDWNHDRRREDEALLACQD
jgi:hypothetical protein